MIYASEHYSTAMLEKLVHGSGRVPSNQHYIEVTIPNGVSYEVFDPRAFPIGAQLGHREQGLRRRLAVQQTLAAIDRAQHRGLD